MQTQLDECPALSGTFQELRELIRNVWTGIHARCQKLFYRESSSRAATQETESTTRSQGAGLRWLRPDGTVEYLSVLNSPLLTPRELYGVSTSRLPHFRPPPPEETTFPPCPYHWEEEEGYDQTTVPDPARIPAPQYQMYDVTAESLDDFILAHTTHQNHVVFTELRDDGSYRVLVGDRPMASEVFAATSNATLQNAPRDTTQTRGRRLLEGMFNEELLRDFPTLMGRFYARYMGPLSTTRIVRQELDEKDEKDSLKVTKPHFPY